MPQKQSSFSRAFKLLLILWSPAFLFSFVGAFSISGILGASRFSFEYVFYAVDFIFSFVLEVIVLAGTFGIIIELLSGETAVTSIERFVRNLAVFWPLALIVCMIPWGVHFFSFLLMGHIGLNIDLIRPCVWIFVFYWAAGRIVRAKYPELCVAKPMDLQPSWRLLYTGVLFLVSNLGLLFLQEFFGQLPLIKGVFIFLSTEVYLFIFAFFVCEFLDANPGICEKFYNSKKLILINPVYSGGIPSLAQMLTSPYPNFFVVLRALTPKTYAVVEYNQIIWRENYYLQDALVAISCFSSNSAEAYKIAREFRARGAKVVMGGPHVSLFPQEALRFCNTVVIGAAESVWETIIRDYEKGELKDIYQGTCSGSAVDRVQKYLLEEAPLEVAAQFIQASRGCKFKCYFCANPALAKYGTLKKPLEDVVALVKRVSSKHKNISFSDNNIYLDPAYAKDLFRALIPLKITWSACSSLDIARDDEALQLLKESGCKRLLIGYEIAAGSLEMKRGGKFSMVQEYIALTRKMQSYGVGIKAQFIFGFPEDTWSSLFRLWWLSVRLSPQLSGLTFLTPIPGSAYFDDVVRDEKIIDLNWRGYSLVRQVVDHGNLGHPFILRRIYGIFVYVFFFTACTGGRVIFVVLTWFFIAWYQSLFLARQSFF